METLRRDLHASAAQCSSLLTRYSKLAQQASTSYSSSGLVKDDLARRSADLEQEITAAFDSVRCTLPTSTSREGVVTRPSLLSSPEWGRHLHSHTR